MIAYTSKYTQINQGLLRRKIDAELLDPPVKPWSLRKDLKNRCSGVYCTIDIGAYMSMMK